MHRTRPPPRRTWCRLAGATLGATLAGLGVLASAACDQAPALTDDGAAPAPAVAMDGPIRFAVLPAFAGQQAEIYGPFVRALDAVVERPVELWVAPDYGALQQALQSGQAQLAQVSAYLYVATALEQARRNGPLFVLAQERSAPGSAPAGVFGVAPATTFRALEDVRGKRAAFVDRASSSGWYYPRLRLRALGLDPDTFFGEVAFAGSHDAVVAALKAGTADVGALSEKAAVISGLRIIERTDPIPEDAVISVLGLSGDERAQIGRWLLTAHEDPSLGNFFIARGLERYVAGVVEVYDAQRNEMLRAGFTGVSSPAPAGPTGEQP